MDQVPAETTLYSMSDEPPAVPSRRSGERHMTLFRVAALITADRRELCLLKNISAGGALVRAYSDLCEGQEVHLELKELHAIAGKVSWVRGSDAGVIFDSKIDVVELLSAGTHGPRPRMPRIETSAIAFIRQGAVLHRAIVNNISQGGLNADCSADLIVGGDVTISLAGLPPQQAVVRWTDQGCYGIAFNVVLGLPILVDWLRSHTGGLAPKAQSPSV